MELALSKHIHQKLLFIGWALILLVLIVLIIFLIIWIFLLIEERLSFKYFLSNIWRVVELFFCSLWKSKSLKHFLLGIFELSGWTTLSCERIDSILNNFFMLLCIFMVFCWISFSQVVPVSLKILGSSRSLLELTLLWPIPGELIKCQGPIIDFPCIRFNRGSYFSPSGLGDNSCHLQKIRN